jgi:site-specific recombinase XerD
MPNFTDRTLKALRLEPGQKDRLVFDDGCPGLGVRVTAAGSRVFIVQWSDRATRRKHREPIGVWGAITIEQARTAARAHLGEIARGLNPTAERRRQRLRDEAERAETALSLNALISSWAQLHLSTRRARYAKETVRALRRALAEHLERPAAKITRADVIAVLDRLASHRKGTMARLVASYGRSCFAWAARRELVTANPFFNAPLAAARSERDRVLTDEELTDILLAAETLPHPWREFYMLALYTLQRREEVAGARWSEFSPDLNLWTVPASRMKNGKPHDALLSAPARELLRAIPRVEGQDLVFTTNGRTPISAFSTVKRRLDAKIIEMRATEAKRLGTTPAPLAPWVLHDLRRSGVTRLAGMGFDSIVVDKLLAHKPARLKGVAAIYQRHEFMEERRRALEAWAAFLTRSPGATILPFKAGGS